MDRTHFCSEHRLFTRSYGLHSLHIKLRTAETHVGLHTSKLSEAGFRERLRYPGRGCLTYRLWEEAFTYMGHEDSLDPVS